MAYSKCGRGGTGGGDAFGGDAPRWGWYPSKGNCTLKVGEVSVFCKLDECSRVYPVCTVRAVLGCVQDKKSDWAGQLTHAMRERVIAACFSLYVKRAKSHMAQYVARSDDACLQIIAHDVGRPPYRLQTPNFHQCQPFVPCLHIRSLVHSIYCMTTHILEMLTYLPSISPPHRRPSTCRISTIYPYFCPSLRAPAFLLSPIPSTDRS